MHTDERREDRDERQRHGDDHRRDPVSGRHGGQHRRRHQAGQHQLRQVPGEIRVQAIQPAGSHGGDLTRLLPSQPAWSEPLQMGGQAAAQL
jgi:hypothetical protein